MLNKIDKLFIVSSVITVISMLIPILIMNTATFLDIENSIVDVLIGCTLFCGIILWLIIIPICYLIQIVTLILKIFARNKTIKDCIIIAINILTLILFGLTILFMFLICNKI